MQASKILGEHLRSVRNPSIIVPLRGSFLPTFFAGVGRREAKVRSLHFMPETGYLHRTKEISHIYLRTYFRGHLKYLEQKWGGEHSPTDEHGFINIVIIDEANSGNGGGSY